MKLDRDKLILGLIVLGGFLLRLRNAGDIPLTADEAFDYSLAAVPGLSNSLGELAKFNANPPLNFILLHFWSRLGDSELMLRLPSAIFGALSIFAVYRLAAAVSGALAGTLAALLFAASPLDVYYSQEARMYSLQIFLSAASTWLFIEYVTTGRRGKLYALCALAAMYTHYFSVFVILAQQVFFLARVIFHKRNDIGRFFRMNAAISVLSLPLVIFGMTQVGAIQELRYGMLHMPPPGLTEIFAGINYMFSGLYPVSRSFFHETGIYSVLTLILLAGCLAVCAYKTARSGWNDGLIYIPTVFAVTVLVPVMIAQFKPFFMNTHLVIALPAMIALIAVGVTLVLPQVAAIAFALVLAATMAPNAWNTTSRQDPYQWKKVTEILMRETEGADTVGAYSTYYLPLVGYYSSRIDKEMPYYHNKKIQVGVFPNLYSGNYPEDVLFKVVEQRVNDIRKRYRRLWLLVTVDNGELDPHGVVRKYLDSREKKVQEFDTQPGLVLYDLGK